MSHLGHDAVFLGVDSNINGLFFLSQSFAEGKLKNADELVKSTVGKMSENEPSPVRSLQLTGSLLPTMVSIGTYTLLY